MKVNWRPDEATKDVLEKMCLDEEIREVDFNEIDIEASRHNKARSVSIDAENLANIKRAMERGDRLPYILLRDYGDVGTSKGRYVIIGGNHRQEAAARLGQKSAPCYVIQCNDDAVVNVLVIVLNRLHGKAVTDEEVYSRAYELWMTGQVDTKQELADTLGVALGTLNNRILVEERTRGLVAKGVQVKGLSHGHINKLALSVFFVVEPEVLKLLAQYCTAKNVSKLRLEEEIKNLESNFQDQQSRIAYLKTLIKRKKVVYRSATTKGGRFLKALDRLEDAVATLTIRDLAFRNDEEKQRCTAQWNRLVRKLNKLLA